jgi:hypothetical protein
MTRSSSVPCTRITRSNKNSSRDGGEDREGRSSSSSSSANVFSTEVMRHADVVLFCRSAQNSFTNLELEDLSSDPTLLSAFSATPGDKNKGERNRCPAASEEYNVNYGARYAIFTDCAPLRPWELSQEARDCPTCDGSIF